MHRTSLRIVEKKNERHALSRHRLPFASLRGPAAPWDFYTLLIGPMYAVLLFFFFFYMASLLSKRGHRATRPGIIFMKLFVAFRLRACVTSPSGNFNVCLCFSSYRASISLLSTRTNADELFQFSESHRARCLRRILRASWGNAFREFFSVIYLPLLRLFQH